jgi:acetolactate synthase small subunit
MKQNGKQGMDGTKVVVVHADDKKGLLGQVLMFFNRRNIAICDMNIARTDIQNMVLITIEVQLLDCDNYILNKLRNIIEVHRVDVYSTNEVQLNKIAFFTLKKECLKTDMWMRLQKYGLVITEMLDDVFVVQKTGAEHDLDELYRQLDGAYLVSYCKSALVVPQSMMAVDLLLQRETC